MLCELVDKGKVVRAGRPSAKRPDWLHFVWRRRDVVDRPSRDRRLEKLAVELLAALGDRGTYHRRNRTTRRRGIA